ncbi:MAG: hypothetical protein M1836_001513 [Candelina mexicana]|nr:MAG: hypothetical protein M1836_001513 [Candelina mexicana]
MTQASSSLPNDLSSAEKGITQLRSAGEQDCEAAAAISSPQGPDAIVGVMVPPRQGESNEDQYLVFWESEDDPANPQNWSSVRKWRTIIIVSAIAFVPPFASSIIAPPISLYMEDFGSSDELLASFAVSVYMLGFAAGTLFLPPLSEIYGRSIIFNATNTLHTVFTVACALSSSLNMLIGFRFLAGCVGSAPITIGGGTISDIMHEEQRGKAMAIFVMGPVLGPSISPVIGGFLAEAAGWRWDLWLLAILLGALTISVFVFLMETYTPELLRRKAKRLRVQTGDLRWTPKIKVDLPPGQLLLRAVTRPTKLLLFSPIVLALALFMAVVYSYLYILFTTFPTVFQTTYGFSIGTVGLVYLGLGIGLTFGTLYIGKTSDLQMQRKSAETGDRKAEYRLPVMTYGSPLIATGLLWYGWSADQHTHWQVHARSLLDSISSARFRVSALASICFFVFCHRFHLSMTAVSLNGITCSRQALKFCQIPVGNVSYHFTVI